MNCVYTDANSGTWDLTDSDEDKEDNVMICHNVLLETPIAGYPKGTCASKLLIDFDKKAAALEFTYENSFPI